MTPAPSAERAQLREQLLRWLNDAYAMELASAEMIDAHIAEAGLSQPMQQQLRLHGAETQEQAKRLRERIIALGGTPSALGSSMSGVLGKIQGSAMSGTGDAIMRNSLAASASEQFEIASYKSLIVAAQLLGDRETMRLCLQSLKEEERMARWLDQHRAAVVEFALRGEGAAGAQAEA